MMTAELNSITTLAKRAKPSATKTPLKASCVPSRSPTITPSSAKASAVASVAAEDQRSCPP